MRTISILLIASATGCACVPTTVAYEEVTRTVAAKRLRCPEASIRLSRFADMTRIAMGCGGEVMITCLEPGEFSGPSGECFPVQDLKMRAGFELRCDRGAIALTPLDGAGHTVGARGCGRQAVYQYVEVSDDKYDWTLSGSVRPRYKSARPMDDESNPGIDPSSED